MAQRLVDTVQGLADVWALDAAATFRSQFTQLNQQVTQAQERLARGRAWHSGWGQFLLQGTLWSLLGGCHPPGGLVGK